MKFGLVAAAIVVAIGLLFIWHGVQPAPEIPASTTYHRDATPEEKRIHEIQEELTRIRVCRSAAPDGQYCK